MYRVALSVAISLKVLRAEIGVAISIASYVMLWVVSASHLGNFFAFCVIAGVALYVWDRKGFLNRRSGDKNTAVGLAILGLALIVINFVLGVFIFLWMGWSQSIIGASYLAFYGLVFVFGVLLFSDHEKMLEDKRRYPPSPQRLDGETQTKYPQALFAKYALQYSHNPEGVLEWHVHKKTKEGKTREQAIKELMQA